MGTASPVRAAFCQAPQARWIDLISSLKKEEKEIAEIFGTEGQAAFRTDRKGDRGQKLRARRTP